MDIGYGRVSRHAARMISIVGDESGRSWLRRHRFAFDLLYALSLASCLTAAAMAGHFAAVPLVVVSAVLMLFRTATGVRIMERTEDAAAFHDVVGGILVLVAVGSVAAAFHDVHLREVVVSAFVIAGGLGIGFHAQAWVIGRRQRREMADLMA